MTDISAVNGVILAAEDFEKAELFQSKALLEDAGAQIRTVSRQQRIEERQEG